jgi:leucyl-tRNA synthetase
MYFFAPHISEELWAMSGHTTLLHEAGVPEFNPEYLVQSQITYVIQVMGKVRGKIEVAADASQDAIKELALANENVQKFIEGKTVHKVIVVPKKLVSIVAK